MKFQALLLAFAVSLGLWACSSQPIEIESEYDPMAIFDGMKTYALQPGTEINIDDKHVHNDFLNGQIQAALDKNLKSRGYKKVHSASPDFWVAYYGVVKRKKDIQTKQSITDIRDLGAEKRNYVSIRKFKEGTLIIDVVDPRTEAPIWRGMAQAELDLTDNWEKKEERIQYAVKNMLKEFPPK